MKVFVSWSGDLSRRVAEVVREFFPNVLQGLDMFMSDADLASGVPWFGDIEENLNKSRFGIIVVTRENQERPWLMFESGALAKSLQKPRVTPLLVDLANADVHGPLSQFQMRTLQREDVLRLLNDMNGEVRQTTIQPGHTTVRRRSGKRASIRTVRPRGKTEW